MKMKILLLDDDEIILETFKYVMTDLNYDVTTFNNAKECLAAASTEDFDLIITDIRMPDINVAEFIDSLLKVKPDANVYILTSYPDDSIVKEALKLGAKGLMEKPFQVSKIVSIMSMLNTTT